ncbi:MAG: hypothetical protein ACLRNQ_29325 [Flavonifractor plautii]
MSPGFPRHPLEAGAVSALDGPAPVRRCRTGALPVPVPPGPPGPLQLQRHHGAGRRDGAGAPARHPDAPFPSLLYEAAALFSGAGPLLAGVAVYHFLCHYQGGRSIYRMRSLPQFGELWRRCLSAPALALLLGAALTAAVILLCALCYYHLTPAGHLPRSPGEACRWAGLEATMLEVSHVSKSTGAVSRPWRM